MAPVAVAAMMGPSLGIAVVWLDRHPFFAAYRLLVRQRWALIGLIVATAVALVAVMASGLTGLLVEPVISGAVALGIASVVYAGA